MNQKGKYNSAYSSCHRKGSQNTQNPTVSETESDQDSANSKYVVQHDDRERRDGPGGD